MSAHARVLSFIEGKWILKESYCFGFQEDKQCFSRSDCQLIIWNGQWRVLFFWRPRIISVNRLQIPEKVPCFYALKYTQCGRELTLCLMCGKSQFVMLILHSNRDKAYLIYFASYLQGRHDWGGSGGGGCNTPPIILSSKSWSELRNFS